MRQLSSWSLRGVNDRTHEGLVHAGNVQAEIQHAGQDLVVTTPAIDGNPAIARTVRFLPQALSASSAANMEREGLLNMAEGTPTDFICAGDTVIRETDEITYDGEVWPILGVQPDRHQGVAIMLHCVAKRAKKV